MTITRDLSWLLCGALALAACKRSETKQAVASAAAPTTSALASTSVPKPRGYRMPMGPRLAVFAGKGVGPIRIGATRETIERHMEAPCEEVTEVLCRYVNRGVDYHLKDGVVQRIHVHRQERPAGGTNADGEPRTYGVFNGAIPPDLRFGMLPLAIEEVLGKPKQVRPVPQGNAFNTKEEHVYPGMVLEYDVYKNGNVILGGIRIPE